MEKKKKKKKLLSDCLLGVVKQSDVILTFLILMVDLRNSIYGKIQVI